MKLPTLKQGDLKVSSIANGGVGYCCLAEVRMYETIETGKPQTPYLKFGDTVRIEMLVPALNPTHTTHHPTRTQQPEQMYFGSPHQHRADGG